jgi:hypothetical protein
VTIYGGELSIPLAMARCPKPFGSLTAYRSKLSFYRSGRDALFAIFNTVRPRRIWLPELVCFSVWHCAREAAPVLMYGIEEDLSVATDSLHAKVVAGDLVLFIATLGSAVDSLLEKFRSGPAYLVADVTHSLVDERHLTRCARNADAMIASLRKTFPLPDGGVAWVKDGILPHPIPADETDPFILHRAAGLMARSLELESGRDDGVNLRMLQQAERLLDQAPALGQAMSDISSELLDRIDLRWMARRTRLNRQRLLQELQTLPRIRIVSDPEAIATYLPLVFENVQDRNALRLALRRRGVFCPVHWPTDFLDVPHTLSLRMLSVPCDARYDPKDMEELSQIILEEANALSIGL